MSICSAMIKTGINKVKTLMEKLADVKESRKKIQKHNFSKYFLR